MNAKSSQTVPETAVEEWGKTNDGVAVQLFTLGNAKGVTAKVTSYGATLTELHVPDKTGNPANVVLGFAALAPYLEPHPYFGATVGRYANRIANASFELDGREYKLVANNGKNSLHGGLKGFDKKVWKAEKVENDDGTAGVTFSLRSPDMEEGFPGTVDVRVTYTLTADALRIDYYGTTDKPTPLNLTNHSYFCLAGAGKRDILDHQLTIEADEYTPVDDGLIPTGRLEKVAGTPLDFRKPEPIGKRIAELEIGGYDHNYVLRRHQVEPTLAATVVDPESGRKMEVLTTEPGVQLYTSNHLDGKISGNGGTYKKHYALCLETQHFPDSVHHKNFPDVILRPGKEYRQTTIYRFSAQ